jgi:hypothetical protein
VGDRDSDGRVLHRMLTLIVIRILLNSSGGGQMAGVCVVGTNTLSTNAGEAQTMFN